MLILELEVLPTPNMEDLDMLFVLRYCVWKELRAGKILAKPSGKNGATWEVFHIWPNNMTNLKAYLKASDV